MRLNELAPSRRSKRSGRRVGRGLGSNRGHTSGRGNKGQNSRSGGGVRRGFEGGQLPLIKRMPSKRGFTNIFRTEYNVVNVGTLNIFEAGSQVGPEDLKARRIVRSLRKPIKVLGEGALSKALVVRANQFSRSAIQKIEAAGGTVEKLS